MKYIIVENKEQKEEELNYEIADFLWNNGNEIYIRDSNAIDFQNIVKNCNCIILLAYNHCSSELLTERDPNRFKKYFELENSRNKKTVLIFSHNGVYSNAIPFPHKIFHFENLEKKEIKRFFIWARTFNLFTKYR